MLIKPSENHYFERPNGRDFGGHGAPKNCFAALVFKTISFSNATQMKAEIIFEKQFAKTISFSNGAEHVDKRKNSFLKRTVMEMYGRTRIE